tara:strand:+ start:95 stop:499 length:405 start_codon:yes stop_codon:yes gene_type:complete
MDCSKPPLIFETISEAVMNVCTSDSVEVAYALEDTPSRIVYNVPTDSLYAGINNVDGFFEVVTISLLSVTPSYMDHTYVRPDCDKVTLPCELQEAIDPVEVNFKGWLRMSVRIVRPGIFAIGLIFFKTTNLCDP